MKKIISILLLFVLIFSLSGCRKENNTSSESNASVQSDISSIGNSTENTTTSTEVSESTQSTNTTPSNTEEPKPTVVAGEYTVTFDYGYDNKKTTAKSKNYKVAKPNNPVRNGYEFLGWYAKNEDTPWSFAGHMVTKDMILTAKWQQEVTSGPQEMFDKNTSSISSSNSSSNSPSYEICSKRGNDLPHKWIRATCTTPEKCEFCKEERSSSTGHTISKNGLCFSCGKSFTPIIVECNGPITFENITMEYYDYSYNMKNGELFLKFVPTERGIEEYFVKITEYKGNVKIASKTIGISQRVASPDYVILEAHLSNETTKIKIEQIS